MFRPDGSLFIYLGVKVQINLVGDSYLYIF